MHVAKVTAGEYAGRIVIIRQEYPEGECLCTVGGGKPDARIPTPYLTLYDDSDSSNRVKGIFDEKQAVLGMTGTTVSISFERLEDAQDVFAWLEAQFDKSE
jgi:hypothetical protein